MEFKEFSEKLGIKDIDTKKFTSFRMTDIVKKIEDFGKPVVIWGASGGGKKVLEVLKKYNVEVKYLVDKDKSKWGKFLEGVEIKSPNELTQDDLAIIGSVHEKSIALELRKKNAHYVSLLLEATSPLLSDSRFDLLNKHLDDLFSIYAALENRGSKEIFRSIIYFALTKDPIHIKTSDYEQYFHPCVKPEKDDVVVDGGAYNGDTIKNIVRNHVSFEKIYAFEPDNSNFEKLKSNIKQIDNVSVLKAGLWSKISKLYFEPEGSDSHIAENGNDCIDTIALDAFFEEKEHPTLIKMDIEGAEMEALRGGQNIIKKYKPKLQICVYHKAEDLYEIPLMLKEWVPEYKMYLGHHTGGWTEIVLYCMI